LRLGPLNGYQHSLQLCSNPPMMRHADNRRSFAAHDFSECAFAALSRYARIWRLVEVRQRICLADAPDDIDGRDARPPDPGHLTRD
jgi:hypothetical protein